VLGRCLFFSLLDDVGVEVVSLSVSYSVVDLDCTAVLLGVTNKSDEGAVVVSSVVELLVDVTLDAGCCASLPGISRTGKLISISSGIKLLSDLEIPVGVSRLLSESDLLTGGGSICSILTAR